MFYSLLIAMTKPLNCDHFRCKSVIVDVVVADVHFILNSSRFAISCGVCDAMYEFVEEKIVNELRVPGLRSPDYY